jgi:hypothetical protein
MAIQDGGSSCWREILYEHEALKLGMIKRIGDGGNTRVWDDPWIPTNPSMKPIVRMPNLGVTNVLNTPLELTVEVKFI